MTPSPAMLAALRGEGLSWGAGHRLHGGACQELWRIDALRGSERVALVARSDAGQSLPGSLTRENEFQIASLAARSGVLTPRPFGFARGLLGPETPGYLMPYVSGEAIGRRVVRNPELQQARQQLPEALARSLAALHAIEPQFVSLRRPTSPARVAIRDLRTMLDGLPVRMPAVELCLSALETRLPVQEEVVLVHGDFRTGNFLVAPTGLTAILDWEFAHLGSPYEDLAWISVRDWRFGRLELPIGGFAVRAPFYQAYTQASGRIVDAQQIWWWELMGNLRWAVGSVFQGQRYLSGTDTDLELIAIAKRAPEMEFEALRLLRHGV
jgi:aminoglycoside phosphotransferase (APT) family kinase protein